MTIVLINAKAMFNQCGYEKEARRSSRLIAPGWSVATTGGLKEFNKIIPVGIPSRHHIHSH